jgi:hypothetical protein
LPARTAKPIIILSRKASSAETKRFSALVKRTSIIAFFAAGAIIRGVNLAPGNFVNPSQITIAVTVGRVGRAVKDKVLYDPKSMRVSPFMVFGVLVGKNKCRPNTMSSRRIVTPV